MKYILSLIIIFSTLTSWSQKSKEFIQKETDKIYDKLVKIRQELHKNPELAGKEKNTQQIIQKYLLDLGLEVKTDLYGNSVVGILKGAKKGKTIAWRADMDALPNDFPDDVEFRSQIKGVQHGCGHDVHMAVALGIADVLSKHKAALQGTVYFIFQPEEETFLGAKRMIENGIFSKIKTDEIYGLHVTALPVGKIMVKPNELFAYQRRIRIELKNDVSDQQSKALAKKIQDKLIRVQPNSKPWEIQLIGDPVAGLTNPNSIFKDYLIMDADFTSYLKNDKRFLESYIYETSVANLSKIIPAVEQLINEEGLNNKLISVKFIQENATVVNDEQLTMNAIKTLKGIYGNDLILPDYGQVPYFNDDFVYFQQKVPGVYFFLGGSNAAKGIVAMYHTPGFKVDEESIRVGVKTFASLIAERLKVKF